jgi:hypothetical protein
MIPTVRSDRENCIVGWVRTNRNALKAVSVSKVQSLVRDHEDLIV